MGLSELPPGSETSLLLNPLKLVRRQVTKLFVQLFATGKLEPGVSARLDCDSLGQTSEVSAHETGEAGPPVDGLWQLVRVNPAGFPSSRSLFLFHV